MAFASGQIPVTDRVARNSSGEALLHFTPLQAQAEAPTIVRGEGCHVFDQTGRKFFDGLASLFCTQIGYSHGAEIAEAAAEQLKALPGAVTIRLASGKVLQAERLHERGGPRCPLSQEQILRKYADNCGRLDPMRDPAVAGLLELARDRLHLDLALPEEKAT